MSISKEQILKLIEEEARAAIQKDFLTEQSRWKIPGDNKYEYSLTPDGKGYVAYENGKALGTYTDAAGLKRVKDAAPAAATTKGSGFLSSLSDWWNSGESEEKPQTKQDWSRESDPNGPIHQLQKALGIKADGIFGKNSRLAWSQKTNGQQLPPTPAEAIKFLSTLKGKETTDSPYGIKYFSTLRGKLKVIDEKILVQGKEARGVVECATDQCAQFVSDSLSQVYTRVLGVQGNAWLAHRWWLPGLVSTFQSKAVNMAPKAALIFSKLNAAEGVGQNRQISELVRSVIPDQNAFKNLDLGTVVGLYYPSSSNHSKAFFEAATQGSFFQTKEGDGWSKDMLGKDIAFEPTPKYAAGGKSFGMNTHLGFVGATYKGEPIIFHNVHGDVRATPLRAMSPNTLSIVWARKGGGGGRLAMIASDLLKRAGLGEQEEKQEEKLLKIIKEELDSSLNEGYFDWLFSPSAKDSLPTSWGHVVPYLKKHGRLGKKPIIIVDGTSYTGQKLLVVSPENKVIKWYFCSAGGNGFGNQSGSGKTSTGLLKISAKVGQGEPVGRVFRSKQPTKYILGPNEGDKAEVCTRVLVLKGLQPANSNVHERKIYIHGTNRHMRLGRAVSGGWKPDRFDIRLRVVE